MYKYLLCWRYLKTRYIALASVISVMLGVATMIVVNSVMAGFADKMRDRIHGALSDIVVEGASIDGFDDYDRVMARIKAVVGPKIEAMAPAIETPGMLSIPMPSGESINQPVKIIGIRADERAKIGSFAEYLFDDSTPPKPVAPSFDVPEALKLRGAGGYFVKQSASATTSDPDPFVEGVKRDVIDAAPDDGAILGFALATFHHKESHRDIFYAPMGSKVILTFPTAGRKIEGRTAAFTTAGFYKSGMSEYDSTNVYIAMERLQQLRGAFGADGRSPKVNRIFIKTKAGVDLDILSEEIRQSLVNFRSMPTYFQVSTWEQKQGSILAAVQVEQSILNILLFFIIAVAGFGILAIFSMIVVEKTRDIGILKALGASSSGVRSIFLGYGLSLGLVGSGVGMAGGLLFVRYINDIETILSKITNRKVFDDSIYYFDRIPTLVSPPTVAWIVGGALFIAVFASVWPAHRASRLHPVRALRYE